MAKKEIIGGIVEKSLREIITQKDFPKEEAELFLNKSLQLVALAMGGYNSISSEDDMKRVMRVIEG
jgi:hypothetical protein